MSIYRTPAPKEPTPPRTWKQWLGKAFLRLARACGVERGAAHPAPPPSAAYRPGMTGAEFAEVIRGWAEEAMPRLQELSERALERSEVAFFKVWRRHLDTGGRATQGDVDAMAKALGIKPPTLTQTLTGHTLSWDVPSGTPRIRFVEELNQQVSAARARKDLN